MTRRGNRRVDSDEITKTPSNHTGDGNADDRQGPESDLPQPLLFHYTDAEGYKAISLQKDWVFQAAQPPGNHPSGAYFTPLTPDQHNLTRRLRIPRTKTEYEFCFHDADDMSPLRGGRGKFIVFAARDYVVTPDRQVYHGLRADWIGESDD